MNALEIALLPESLPFSGALTLMLLLGVVAALGFDLDHDMDADAHIPLVDFMNAGRLPLMMTFVVFLGTYGTIGIAGQEILYNVVGHTLPTLPASLAAIPAAILVSNPVSRIVGRIMPKDETTAITIDELIGTRGRIAIGTAKAGFPARAVFKDRHSQDHHLMVEPQDTSHEYPQDTEVLLVSHDGTGSHVIAAGAWPPASL